MESAATFFQEATVKGGGSPLTGRNGLGSPDYQFRNTKKKVPLDELLKQIQEMADLPLEESKTLPAETYTSEEFLDWEIENVLGGGWMCLAHQSQIPKPGDFINMDIMGEPMIVVHGKDGEFRVLSRVCPHRAMDIMPPGFGYDGHGPAEARDGKSDCGHTRIFLCPYHHWSFELDGKMKGGPEMHKAKNFCRQDVGLKTYRSEVWQGFIFVNISGDAEPLAEQYQELKKDVQGWQMEDMDVVIAKSWDCPFNWKVLVENFMEGYHHMGAHCKTLQPLMPARDTWTDGEHSHSVRVNLPYRDSVPTTGDSDFEAIPTLDPEHYRQMAVFLGQPTFLLFTAPDRVFWYRIEPISADRSRLLTTCMVPKKAKEDPKYDEKMEEAEKMLVDFHLEDMEVCTAVQRGFYAKGYQRGRLSHLEMPLWLIHRYYAARARGTYPTFDRPAAPSQAPS
ncbi:aromatic ring-hydroxylating oxygenase subunit alpha [Puniceicoccus vermicola]|uniref:Aromatic ring-hydroxylating dioxygenase subunit alpha n=1 Tax=Puniceicoccus vermicola TaxID=388746 RepID=A0A7X1B169_9BACT|nr:aromatic ring-hydroxylating dioxygenase subunit alpha [Puniceicoccus vermicola]MBC2603736.1 aromatic ring-hydroxylating dioxygenase subunit alpha [Puniceicoccus vermicola]